MQRFYIENLETNNYNFILNDKDIVNQILKVFRWKIWDKFVFFDWKELYDYIFEVKEIWKKEISFEQIWREKKESEINFELNLFQALPNKIDKIENIIKNWTQIGITNFLFFKSERSQKLNISEKKEERLNKIILESSEQSERNIIPQLIIWDKIDFTNLEGEKLFLHTKSSTNINSNEKIKFNISKMLKEVELTGNKIVNIFIWPEWGFSEEEVLEFEKHDFYRIYLWNRILRTELAGISSAFYIIQNN